MAKTRAQSGVRKPRASASKQASGSIPKQSTASRRSTRSKPKEPAASSIQVETSISVNTQSGQTRGKKRQLPQTPTKRSKATVAKPAIEVKPEASQMSATPNWLDFRIPFQAWLDIFTFAASDGSTMTPNCHWLIGAATTCKTLSEPALAVLYRSPAIRSPVKAKRLLSVLEKPASQTMSNYLPKIDSLIVDVENVQHAVLASLIKPLPSLRDIVLFTKRDESPYSDLLFHSLHWHYEPSLFEALEPTEPGGSKPFPTMLKSWEWSGRFIRGCKVVPNLDAVIRIHQTKPFQRLTKLSFMNLPCPPPSGSFEPHDAPNDKLAKAIAQLPSLTDLRFETCIFIDGNLLTELPMGLKRLEIVNCTFVDSGDLQAFLKTHGRSLEYLKAAHNYYMSMQFIQTLGTSCPNLREFHFNMLSFEPHDDYESLECALHYNEPPSWPPALRVLSLEHVHRWLPEACEMFLQSLIDKASALPDLRYIHIKTMLDIPWQSRARMRQKWRKKLEAVFLQDKLNPNNWPTMQSVLDSVRDGSVKTLPEDKKVEDDHTPARRSGRLAATKEGKRRTRPSRYTEPETDSSESESGGVSLSTEGGSSDENEEPIFRQGRCKTVNILLDNQKVRELQYSMEDFLEDFDDSEGSWEGDFEEDDPVAFET